MQPEPREVVIFSPTPNEFAAVKRLAGDKSYKNFKAVVVESGPGKINAAFKMAQELLPRLARNQKPILVMGAGTSGSLNLKLAEGDVVASAATLISDWRMEDDGGRQFGPYGLFQYAPLGPETGAALELSCREPLVTALLDRLSREGFKSGRLMTSDSFVAGRETKLSSGEKFGCVVCDMESGAFAYVAQNLLGGLPWLHLRIVADTLDESLTEYFHKEVDMVEVLGAKTAEALKALDDLLDNQ